ncbi:hypothetical protein ACLB2K_001610 [Fragaria x ananassa]
MLDRELEEKLASIVGSASVLTPNIPTICEVCRQHEGETQDDGKRTKHFLAMVIGDLQPENLGLPSSSDSSTI